MTLSPLPPRFATTRSALHQLAFFAVSPTRFRATGRMGLTATPGGFGTPPFGGRTSRVEGSLLVDENEGNVATQGITTIRAAASFFGHEYEVNWFDDFHDPLAPADPDLKLEVDEESSAVLASWFEFGFAVLEEMRGHAVEGDVASEVQLWPEHFDPATELGEYDLGQRASFGASPGDDAHDDPYLYVASWSEIDRSNPYWNDPAFNGGSLGYRELLASGDPHDRSMEFLLDGQRILHAG